MTTTIRRSHEEALGGSIGGMFRDTVLNAPTAPALRLKTETLTYDELNHRVNRLSAFLHSQGLVYGERVAVLAENCAEYVVIILACAKLGLIAACINWRQAAGEIVQSICLVEPKVVFVSNAFADVLGEAKLNTKVIILDETFDQTLSSGDSCEPSVAVNSEDGLLILYTSGTTGRSKGALISHRAMIARGMLMRADWGIRRSDGFIAWSPLFHMASADPTLATLIQGGTVSIVAGFDATEIVKALTRHDVGWLVLMPGMIERLAQALEKNTAPVRRVAVAGCMANLVPTKQISRISRLLSAPFLNSFGSSETGIAPASGNWIDVGHEPTSFGKLQSSCCEIRLTDEAGQGVALGEVGEMCLRSPLLFSGYWNDPNATEVALRDGWYHMGDDFYRDHDGLLHFTDRRKYLIKSGGENIYPAEIELVLRNAAGIAEAVVVRRPDEHWGEVPVAFVVAQGPDINEKSVRQLLAGCIARYKMPKEIYLISDRDIERNSTGKIRRDLLETRAIQNASEAGSGRR